MLLRLRFVVNVLAHRVIKRCNQLDQGAVDATSINAFKSKLDTLRYTRMGFFMHQSAEPPGGTPASEAAQGE